MKVGAFELYEPVPKLKGAHAFLMISPWIDVGSVGTLTLSFLERHFQAREMGKLRRPGLFYDFTRYRPMLYLVEGQRRIKIPNTYINYAQTEGANDLIFIHCLEPHMMGETFADSILRLLEALEVRRCCILGSMYDSVPHTRPLIITGTSSNKELERELRKLNINSSSYQGPTTITILVSEQAPRRGIETLTLIVHLPFYARLEEDNTGQYYLLSTLSALYEFSLDLDEIKQRGEEQYKRLSMAVEQNPQLKEMIKAMEAKYDAEASRKKVEAPLKLSPEMEEILREITKKLDYEE